MSKHKFSEPCGLTKVAEFHSTFKLPVVDQPGIPSVERCTLRIALLEEELEELKEAVAMGDLVEAADAFADLQYVLSGAILEFGLGSKFQALFDEVHRSNMSKVCKSEKEAEATLTHYKTDKNTEGYIREESDHFLVYRKEDGKVLKSVEYSPANLESVLNR